MVESFDFVEIKVPAKALYVGVVRLTVSGIANRMGFSYDTIEDLKVAISEAATNVVDHAYDHDEIGELNLGFGIYKNKLEVMISDQGESFNLEDIKNRIGPVSEKEELSPASQLREGGFGLFLINTLMDKVEINNDYGVTILMTKYLDETEVDENEHVATK